MPFFYQFVYFVTTFLMLVLAVGIFLRRPNERIVQAFTGLVLSIAGWAITLYLYYSFSESGTVLLLGRINFFLASLIAYFAFLFAFHFPHKSKIPGREIHIIILISTIALGFVTLGTPLVGAEEIVKGISRESVYGPLYPAFMLHFVVLALTSVLILLGKYRKKETTVEQKIQIKIVSGGMVIAFAIGITTNIILPFTTGLFDVQHLGPIGPLLFSMAVAYTVAKHQAMRIKVLVTEFFVVALLLIFVINIAISTTLPHLLVGLVSLILASLVSVLLVRSSKREQEQYDELQKVYKELQSRNVQLKKLDTLKTTMVSIASHQLRGPLGGMRGYLTMFKDGDLGPLTDKQKDIVKMNLSTLSRLLNAVETFLDITKIEAGKMVLRKEVLPLDQAVHDVTHEFEIMVRRKGLDLEMDIEEHVWVEFDPEKIKHVIFNLVDNAMKYTETGSIKVSLHKEDNEAVVMVTDTGKGVLKEDLARLFGRFERGTLTVDRGGSGLGLYIVKMLTEMQGGKVDVTSPGEGKGTTFHVRLPLAKEHH